MKEKFKDIPLSVKIIERDYLANIKQFNQGRVSLIKTFF